jgi:outer membrane biosynthesis protein TonB
MKLLGPVVLALLFLGCDRPSPEVQTPILVTNVAPAVEAPSHDTSEVEDTLKQPPSEAPVPSAHRPPRPPQPKPKSHDPSRIAPRDPTRPENSQAKTEPERKPPPRKKQPRKPPPRLELPQPDYPTAPPRDRPEPPDTVASTSGQIVIAANGLGLQDPDGYLQVLDEEAAYPTHHPPVVIHEWRDEQWLTACFELQPNGRFRVTLVEGTGDPGIDGRALSVLRQWKWQPRTVSGRPVASVETVRLRRSVSQEP